MRTETVTRKVQYAALPWRSTPAGIEVLLITTLNTRRWIVPKGWPLDGLAPHESAAQEALEEAGISGKIEPGAIGSFHYEKLRKNGERVSCAVDVFPLRVELQHKRWMEKGARELCWCSIQEALARIGEPGLRQLIARFAAGHQSAARKNPATVRLAGPRKANAVHQQ
jgi:8-oxo-dGTP pyrophosphatase MutT (NUDIX family)